MAGETGGQAGVLALLADGQGQLIVGHQDPEGLLALDGGHGNHVGRGKGRRHKLGGILGPDHDVHLFTPELVHHSRHTGASGTHAGANGIQVFVHRMDRQLGAGAGLPGHGLDFHFAGGDFGDVQLEQPLHQARMGPGHDDLGPPVAAADLHHVDPDQVALVVELALDLLVVGQVGVGAVVALADADGHIPGVGVDPQDGAGEDLMLLGGELVEDHAPFGFPDALDDDLLGGLGGNPAEGLGLDLLVDQVAQLALGVDGPGGLDLDLGGGGEDLLHDLLLGIHLHGGLVQLYEHVVGIAGPVLFIGSQQSLGDAVHHVIHGDSPLPLQLTECCKNFGIRIGCHCLFPPVSI